MTDRATALIRDIEAIPGCLELLADDSDLRAAFADVLRRGGPRPRRVLLTGLGSSRFAALHVEDHLRAMGLEVIVEPASADSGTEPAPDRLCVAISSSGRTPEVVAAALHHRAAGPVLAITRDAGSPLAAAADAVAVLPVEAETSGVATTTFVATIAVLLHLAAAIDPRPDPRSGPRPAAGVSPRLVLAAAAARGRAILDARAAWLPGALATLDRTEEVAVLAPWSGRGVAEQSALLFREGPRRSATVHETAEWLHVGIYTALPGSVALLFDGSPADAEVARTIAGRSGRLLRASSLGPVPEPGAAPGASPASDEALMLARLVGVSLLAAEWWRSSAPLPNGG